MQFGYKMSRNYYPLPQNKNWHWLDPENMYMQVLGTEGVTCIFKTAVMVALASYMHEHNNNTRGSKELYHERKISVVTLPKLEESNHKKIHVVL